MRAVLCEAPGRLAVVERPRPVAGPGEVLVRIRRVGVCGTDFHIFGGRHPFLDYPRVMGHELSGTVEAAPEGSALEAGETVYVVPYLSCGRCAACRKGLTNACMAIRVLGVHCDGGMAEYLAVPEGNVVPADGASLDDAAMVEFLAIGAHGVKRGAVTGADRVLVVGSGPIGMSAVIFAKARGAHVTAMDTRKGRLAFAADRLGADATLMADAATEAGVASATGGDGFEVVIDATGNAGAMRRGFGFVGHGGRYVLLGVVRDDVSFSDPEFHKREATLLASRNAQPDDFAEVVRQMGAGRVPTAALNTHRGALTDAPGLFEDWMRPETGVIKALIEV